MFLEIPSDLVSLKDSQYVSTSNDIDLIMYNSHFDYSKNEVILNKTLFLFIITGQKNIAIGNENLVLNRGSGAVVGSGAYVMTEIGSDQVGKFSSLMILVSDTALLDIWQKVQELCGEIDDLLTSHGGCDWVFLERSSIFTTALKTIDLYFQNSNQMPHYLLSIKLQEILIYLLQTNRSSQIKQLIRHLS